jgi:hypothetical protein
VGSLTHCCRIIPFLAFSPELPIVRLVFAVSQIVACVEYIYLSYVKFLELADPKDSYLKVHNLTWSNLQIQ